MASYDVPSDEWYLAVRRFLKDGKSLQDFVTADACDEDDFERVSVILYRWVLDGSPFLQKLFSSIGQRLFFIQCVEWKSDLTRKKEEIDEFYWPLLERISGSGGNYEVRTLDQYIRSQLGVWNSTEVTPKRLIELWRHKMGGAHFEGLESLPPELRALYSAARRNEFKTPVGNFDFKSPMRTFMSNAVWPALNSAFAFNANLEKTGERQAFEKWSEGFEGKIVTDIRLRQPERGEGQT